MTGPDPEKGKTMMFLQSSLETLTNPHTSPSCRSTSPTTLYSLQDNPYSKVKNAQKSAPHPDECFSRSRRPQDNPYSRMTNDLGRRPHPPGNPNVRQTVLAKAPDGWSASNPDSRARKRQKLDTGIRSTITSNGASSYANGSAPRGDVSEPDIQLIEVSRTTNNRGNPVSNDAEIIIIGASSDDLGEPISHSRSSSSDPLCLRSNKPDRPLHAFETLPKEYSLPASKKGKGRAKEHPEFLKRPEEDDEISQFTSPPPSTKKSEDIPKNIVHDRKAFFENGGSSAPAATRHPVEKVTAIDLTTGTVISKMRKRVEGALENQRSTGVSDPVGTSSTNFLNSAREKIQTLPLQAWCLGQHLFEHFEDAPIKLTYEVALHRIRVTWGRSPPENLEFKLDRDVRSAMIVNDPKEPLRENVVVQFRTEPGSTWKKIERKYKGFKADGDRGREALTFLFPTVKHRGFTHTDYQTFVTGIRRPFKVSAVEIIQPSKGASIWDYASRLAEMYRQTESRNTKGDRSENVQDEPSAFRSVTPCSSASLKTGPESIPPNGDSGSSTSHRRSARQSAIRSLRASPPLPPQAQPETDEVVLMYPPTGTGALSIMLSDLKRLQPEEYLNDTLIEFGLKLWLNDLRERTQRWRIKFTSSALSSTRNLTTKRIRRMDIRACVSGPPKLIYSRRNIFIVPINENIHWYLAIIYEPGHTLEPPLLLSQLSGARMTRTRKQKQQRPKAHSGSFTEIPLERLSPAAHVTEEDPEADTSSMDATRATTPSTTENQEMDDVAITIFDRSCSITAGSQPVFTTSSEVQMRDPSPNLVHPPSDSMDVDADTSVTDPVPNTTLQVAEVQEPPTSKQSSGIPVSRFYGSISKQGNPEPVVIADNEDSGEDQQQEAEVDDMLAVTQYSTGDLPAAQTYIFTLDSLGTRHPQAIKVLKQYLEREAKDKYNFDEVRVAVGKQVQVPVQPNTWDCGIYLLNFVKVLMSAPSEFVEQILSVRDIHTNMPAEITTPLQTRGTMPSSERKKMWQDHEVPEFRDHLKSRIIQLSQEWKAEKTVREEDANKRSGDPVEVETLSSEGEVDIVEDIPVVKATRGPKQRQHATRLRG
ncbi:hypothetical protein JVT61DRAFT_1195 [Boletus reticuloceps]|uniref:Ubiquitin-like protease family profile domain-containing protein n=1 Tax=Boletus reticuloceps TaxID=495285 RepID=A0A8I2YUB8_9AGAM|nr:hypothetical protein JVT61DRAFT_1195 [Boletus reticuloceps]